MCYTQWLVHSHTFTKGVRLEKGFSVVKIYILFLAFVMFAILSAVTAGWWQAASYQLLELTVLMLSVVWTIAWRLIQWAAATAVITEWAAGSRQRWRAETKTLGCSDRIYFILVPNDLKNKLKFRLQPSGALTAVCNNWKEVEMIEISVRKQFKTIVLIFFFAYEWGFYSVLQFVCFSFCFINQSVSSWEGTLWMLPPFTPHRTRRNLSNYLCS